MDAGLLGNDGGGERECVWIIVAQDGVVDGSVDVGIDDGIYDRMEIREENGGWGR